MLEKMFSANANRDVEPPKAVGDKIWSMVDSGSQPNVTNAAVEFPDHEVVESEGQRSGLRYKTADGSFVKNEGQITITHMEPDGELYNFVLQNAKVHCTILSVRELVTHDCVVTFHREGGHIQYPNGKRIAFVIREGGSSLWLSMFFRRGAKMFWAAR